MTVTSENAPVNSVEATVMALVSENPIKAALAKEKPALQGWFVGQIMKRTGGIIPVEEVKRKVEIAFMRQ